MAPKCLLLLSATHMPIPSHVFDPEQGQFVPVQLVSSWPFGRFEHVPAKATETKQDMHMVSHAVPQQAPSTQNSPTLQSPADLHPSPCVHLLGGHDDPPQSTPVSVPFLTPSLQL